MAKRETKAERSERVQKVLEALDREYGTEYRCYLNHETPWQLLIAVIMSAQCTDARVNIVTADLFQKYDTLEKFAQADLKELERDIHSIGFYHNKAKNIIACCKALVEDYHGEVPRTIEELTGLAGVGRKTANVIRGNIYGEPSIVVDTHVKRISRKLGFAKEEDPEKIEYELMKVIPEDHWILWNIHVITLGRTICIARSPKCEECFLREFCPSAGGEKNEKSGARKMSGTETKASTVAKRKFPAGTQEKVAPAIQEKVPSGTQEKVRIRTSTRARAKMASGSTSGTTSRKGASS